jgi:hypothetical protein
VVGATSSSEQASNSCTRPSRRQRLPRGCRIHDASAVADERQGVPIAGRTKQQQGYGQVILRPRGRVQTREQDSNLDKPNDRVKSETFVVDAEEKPYSSKKLRSASATSPSTNTLSRTA